MMLELVLFAAPLVLLWLWLKHKMSYWQRRGIAHKRPDLGYGNLKGVMEHKHFAEVFREAYESFRGTGPFAGFYMLCNAAALILDLDLAKRILIKDFQYFSERGFFYNERDDPLSTHIFSLPSDEWRQLRAKLSPAFTTGKLKLMFPAVRDIGVKLGELIESEIVRCNAQTFELKDLTDRFTTDVIGSCIFGLNCNSLHDPSTEFRAMNQNLFDNPRNHRVVDGLIYAFPKLARFLRLKQVPDVTSAFYFRVVKETILYRERNNVKRNDLMNMMLELKSSGAITLNEIVANAFLFFFAGFETSSTTMALALYELAWNPACQQRVRAEILEKIAQFGGEFTYECSQAMPYLDQVISETLRKHTIIPQLQRIALADYNTADSKFYIPKGTLVLIPIDAIHRDPAFYPEPEKFRPERFAPEELKARHPLAWMPFGEGPRNCIGMSMGKMQMRVGLVSLLRHYRFSVVEETPPKLDYYVQCPFLVPKSGIYLRVDKI